MSENRRTEFHSVRPFGTGEASAARAGGRSGTPSYRPRRRFALLGMLLLGWLATGFYVVRGNEQAVVRRCGRLVTTGEGVPRLVTSGLHYELPWPLSQVDRVNVNEVRTLSIGEVDFEDGGDFLQTVDPLVRSQFLTGDKNILNLQVTVQYQVSGPDVADYLFAAENAEDHLRHVVEAAAADLVSRSGVDFVHPLGLGRLRALLTERVRALADEQRLGIVVDDVTISAVSPPIQVKAHFLDVSNARADKDKYVQAALTSAEQEREAARAREREILDAAFIERQQQVESARGQADRFRQIVAEFRRDAESGHQTYAAARLMAMRRLYLETMEEVLANVAGKVFLDSGKPVDLTILRDPKE
ncbi:MAG TPA: protease modulator HflK [Planctomycetaceae bacterium]|nr:protease modulator HflK [Planctomycetaceae bacterium]